MRNTKGFVAGEQPEDVYILMYSVCCLGLGMQHIARTLALYAWGPRYNSQSWQKNEKSLAQKALGKQRQEDQEVKVSLGSTRSYLKTNK